MLFVSINCLSSPLFANTYCSYADELLHVFVNKVGSLYGEDQYVYNVHCLVHLAKDVMRYGTLDRFSAFPFESYLGKLKKLTKNPKFPLQQVIRRLSEQRGNSLKKKKFLVMELLRNSIGMVHYCNSIKVYCNLGSCI